VRIVVYRYACAARLDLSERGLEQLRLAHALRNELIAIWQRHQDGIARAWQTHPEVATAAEAVQHLQESYEQILQAWRASKTRRQPQGDVALYQTLTDLRTLLQGARADLKAKKQAAHQQLAPTFQELTRTHQAAVKDTYRVFSQQGGLYWPTDHHVRDQHLDLAARVARARRVGKRAHLHPRPWTGEGELAMQLRRPAGAPARTPDLLASGAGPWAKMVRLPKLSDRKTRAPLAIRIGTHQGQPIWEEIPQVIWHRPPPADADIVKVVVARRRLASHYRLWVQITARLPDPPPSQAPAVCGLDTGWRIMPDDSLRIGVWRTSSPTPPLRVPEHLVDAIHPDPQGGEIRIPARWVQRWQQADQLRSRRDQHRNQLRADLDRHGHLDQLDQLAAQYLPQGENDPAGLWQSRARLAKLAIAIRDTNPALGRRLEAWRKQDRRLWERETGLRRRAIAYRTDLYRVLANRLCQQYHTIGVEQPYVATVTRGRQTDQQVNLAIRRMVRIAAPGSLVHAIRDAATAHGARLRELPAANTTVQHRECGYRNQQPAPAQSHLMRCDGCGQPYDQDVNAAWTLAERATNS
jgi:hypothetical protein